MLKHIISLLCLAMILSVGARAEETTVDDSTGVTTIDSVEAINSDSTGITVSDQLVVYYLHGNRRCMTCKKLEAYSEEAISSAFKKELDAESIVWRTVNFEEEENIHFVKEYQLYSQSLVLSRLQDGQEIKWKNLDRIWKLVGDKEEFIAYVQNGVREFLNSVGE